MPEISLQNGLYHFKTPPMPRETDIWFHDLKKADQYWGMPNVKTKWLNPDWSFKDVRKMTNERDKIAYISYWRNVWENGLWVMIKGEPTYLTGMHIEHILFHKFNGIRLRYLSKQRLRFYFRELTNNDPKCDGRLWEKPRRAGITLEVITEAIRATLSDFSNNVIYQSDTLEKAQSTLMAPTIAAYISRPSWLREIYYKSNGKTPIKKLQLKSVVLDEDDESPLGGVIEPLPNVASAADGKEAVLFVIDEFSKHEQADPYEMFEVNKRAANPLKKIKFDCLSTTGDTKGALKATKAWHKLIANSNPLILNSNGKTNSGLWDYFEDATGSLFIEQEIPGIIDKYGDIDKERAEEWVWNEHNKYAPGSQEYIFSLYKFPMKKEHVLLSPNINNGYFNRVRIAKRRDELLAMPYDQRPYVRGVLVEDSDGEVYFISDAERQKDAGGIPIKPGPWLIAIHPDTRYRRERYTRMGEFLFPLKQIEFGAAYDPINYPKNQVVRNSRSLSRAAITVHKKYDYYNLPDSEHFVEDQKAAIYIDRPDSPHDANQEAIKCCKYFGCRMGFERSVAHVLEDFEEAKMVGFLVEDHNGIPGYSPNDLALRKNGVAMLQARYRNPQTPDDVDHFAIHPFEDSLMDLEGLDINNSTEYDLAMTELYLEVVLKSILWSNVDDDDEESAVDLMERIIAPRKKR
jgi:hypothetical protein